MNRSFFDSHDFIGISKFKKEPVLCSDSSIYFGVKNRRKSLKLEMHSMFSLNEMNNK